VIEKKRLDRENDVQWLSLSSLDDLTELKEIHHIHILSTRQLNISKTINEIFQIFINNFFEILNKFFFSQNFSLVIIFHQ
jgi:hypothetical protein